MSINYKNILVKDAQQEDVGDIVNIQRASWPLTYTSPENSVTKEWVEEKIKNFSGNLESEAIKDPNKTAIVVKYDNKTTGYLIGYKEKDFNHLYSIYVHPDYTGIGIGKVMMEYFLGWADKSKPSYVEVAQYNNAAIRFYENFGFRRTSDTVLFKLDDIIPIIELKLQPIE